MRSYALLLIAVLCGQFLHAQESRHKKYLEDQEPVLYPQAIELTYSPHDVILICKVDAKSFSADSGEFYVVLTITRGSYKKWFRLDSVTAPSLTLISPDRKAGKIWCDRDSVWLARPDYINLHYNAAFEMSRKEIDFLQANEIRTLTFTINSTALTLQLPRRSGKTLMKLIKDHW